MIVNADDSLNKQFYVTFLFITGKEMRSGILDSSLKKDKEETKRKLEAMKRC